MYFSIIVPVYQTEQYLRTCVDSILAQTYGELELILVDDGSTDGSPALCDAYAARDSRVRVIHQPNLGVVRARQAGLRASAGSHLLFVDSDDWLAPHCLARGRELMARTQADMILFAACRVYEDGRQAVFEPVPEGLYTGKAGQDRLFPALVLDERMRHLSYSCSGKIFCRPLAEKGLCSVPPEIRLGEDMLGVLPAYLSARSIYVCREVMNFYRIREQSVSHSFQMEHFDQLVRVVEQLERMKEQEPGLPADFARQIDRYGAYMSFTLMVHAAHSGAGGYLDEIKGQICRPALNNHIRRARFRGITGKTRITYALLRRGMVVPAYEFLRLCRRIKACLRRAAQWISR